MAPFHDPCTDSGTLDYPSPEATLGTIVRAPIRQVASNDAPPAWTGVPKNMGNHWLLTATYLLATTEHEFLAAGVTLLVTASGDLMLHPLGLRNLPHNAHIVMPLDAHTDPVVVARALRRVFETFHRPKE
jgi:hypothetical protein